MKQLLNPLLKIATPLLLVVTAAQPAGAYIVGNAACNSWLPGVQTTPVKTEKYKDCWPDCLTSISPRHNFVKVTIVDFTVANFDGPLKLAVMSNDSRLSESPYMQVRDLGKGGNTSVSNWWKYQFDGLQPRHFYTVAIYSTDSGYGLEKPFYRACFLTSDEPPSE